MLAKDSEPADGLHGDSEAWQDLAVDGPQNGGFATNLIFFGQQRKLNSRQFCPELLKSGSFSFSFV